MAHGRLAATLFRTDTSKPAIAVGSQYDEDRASFVLNQFDPLLLGLLRLFPRHFPNYASAVDPALEARRVTEMTWLRAAFEAQIRQFPRSAQWSHLVRRLIDL
jgi:hypothetical protein